MTSAGSKNLSCTERFGHSWRFGSRRGSSHHAIGSTRVQPEIDRLRRQRKGKPVVHLIACVALAGKVWNVVLRRPGAGEDVPPNGHSARSGLREHVCWFYPIIRVVPSKIFAASRARSRGPVREARLMAPIVWRWSSSTRAVLGCCATTTRQRSPRWTLRTTSCSVGELEKLAARW
jgi:hypothetical protein